MEEKKETELKYYEIEYRHIKTLLAVFGISYLTGFNYTQQKQRFFDRTVPVELKVMDRALTEKAS